MRHVCTDMCTPASPKRFPTVLPAKVSQLHVHITARLASDPSWPGPCYGAVPAKEMSRIEVEQAVFTLQKAIKG